MNNNNSSNIIIGSQFAAAPKQQQRKLFLGWNEYRRTRRRCAAETIRSMNRNWIDKSIETHPSCTSERETSENDRVLRHGTVIVWEFFTGGKIVEHFLFGLFFSLRSFVRFTYCCFLYSCLSTYQISPCLPILCRWRAHRQTCEAHFARLHFYQANFNLYSRCQQLWVDEQQQLPK